MSAEELLKIIRRNLDDSLTVELTSPTMYDPDELQNKVSFSIIESSPEGYYNRFMVTVEDLRKPKPHV